MLVDILGTSWDQCRSMVQYSFTSTETRRLVRTDSPGRPPWLSHSSWTMTLPAQRTGFNVWRQTASRKDKHRIVQDKAVPVGCLSPAPLHGMTFLFLSKQYPLWTPSNLTSRHFPVQNNKPATLSTVRCYLPPTQVPVYCIYIHHAQFILGWSVEKTHEQSN